MSLPSSDAAVGLIVNNGQILLIRRITREGDPWSGQIALPGGFFKNEENAETAVLREIYEETNLVLKESQIRMEMPVQHTLSRSGPNVHPFIIEASNYEGASPGPEVSDIRVARLSDLELIDYPRGDGKAFVNNGWLIWGLTYRILSRYINYLSTGTLEP